MGHARHRSRNPSLSQKAYEMELRLVVAAVGSVQSTDPPPEAAATPSERLSQRGVQLRETGLPAGHSGGGPRLALPHLAQQLPACFAP